MGWMDKGTSVGWRSALMAPVCFVIRSCVKRHRGKKWGWSDDGQGNRPREKGKKRGQISRQTEWSQCKREEERKQRKEEIRGQLRENWRGRLLKKAKRSSSHRLISNWSCAIVPSASIWVHNECVCLRWGERTSLTSKVLDTTFWKGTSQPQAQ